MRGHSIALGLLVLLAAPGAGCDEQRDRDDAPDPEPTQIPPEPEEHESPVDDEEEEADEPEPTPTQALMRGHFEQATDARVALIRGDLKTAAAAMRWLAEHPLQDMVAPEMRALLAPMQAAASEFGKASTLREAGRALGHTLTRCGECHTKSGKGPSFPMQALPEGEDPPDHMQRHLWAAERMLEGLVTGSNERYMAGAAALSELPVALEKLRPPEQLTGELEALQKHVHELQPRAVDAADASARADVYGDLLATCAACHRMLHRGPI